VNQDKVAFFCIRQQGGLCAGGSVNCSLTPFIANLILILLFDTFWVNLWFAERLNPSLMSVISAIRIE